MQKKKKQSLILFFEKEEHFKVLIIFSTKTDVFDNSHYVCALSLGN